MARARNIKPGFFKNEILGASDPLYSLLFEGLWVLADRAGRLEDRPLRIKGEIFPYRDGLEVDSMLAWLEDNGFIQRYTSKGKKCILVLEFVKHQNPHKNETESELPAPSNKTSNSEKIGTKPEIIGSTRADSLSTDSLKLKPSAAIAARFDDFWNAWPTSERKQDKAKCASKWKTDKLDSLIDTILADIAVKRRTDKWHGGYIEAPLVYLNNRRWEDGVQPQSEAPAGLSDPDSQAAIQAEGIANGIGAWDAMFEQWPSYKARVRGKPAPALNISQLADMAAKRRSS